MISTVNSREDVLFCGPEGMKLKMEGNAGIIICGKGLIQGLQALTFIESRPEQAMSG